MIRKVNSDHSITIEGSKNVIENLKKKLSDILGTSDPIDDSLFLELKTVLKVRLNKDGQPISNRVKDEFQKQKEKVTPKYTVKCKNFIKSLIKNNGEEESEPVELPKPPIGSLSFEEVKAEFCFEQNPKDPKLYFITIPENLSETFEIIKKAYQPKDNRFTILEDPANKSTIIYSFEILSPNKLQLRRFFTDKDDEHFVYTALRLLCFYQQKGSSPYLSLFKERAASYLISCFPEPPKLPFSKIPEFHCELMDEDYEIPPIELFVKNPARISVYQATFLIEIFCEIQDKSSKCNFDKSYIKSKTIYLLSILSPLPVAFEYINSESSVEITFADTSIASADFIFEQVKFAMRLFSKLPQFSANFYNVDSVYWPSEKFISVYEKTGLAIVRSQDQGVNGRAASFCVWAILSKPIINNDLTQVQQLRKDLKKIYEEITLYKCDHCDKWYSIGFGGECIITEHAGERACFPGTNEMERISYIQEGNKLVEMKSVYYTCCGEVSENSAGCFEMVFQGHKAKTNERGEPMSCSSYKDQYTVPE